MIGLDTNILIRYFAQDEAKQAKKASALIHSLSPESPGFVSMVTMVEIVWVLEYSYKLPKKHILEILKQLIQARELIIENASVIIRATQQFESGRADFADYVIAGSATAAGCDYTVTFDRLAATSPTMKLL